MVITWTINDLDIKAQAIIVGSDDNIVGSSWMLEDAVDLLERYPDVAVEDDGSFALVWESYDENSYDSLLKMQSYD